VNTSQAGRGTRRSADPRGNRHWHHVDAADIDTHQNPTEPTMNMTTTRLEDRVNAVLLIVAICGMLGLGLSTAEGSALSRDGAYAATQPSPPATTIALLASR
jgi:hypothetical protein